MLLHSLHIQPNTPRSLLPETQGMLSAACVACSRSARSDAAHPYCAGKWACLHWLSENSLPASSGALACPCAACTLAPCHSGRSIASFACTLLLSKSQGVVRALLQGLAADIARAGPTETAGDGAAPSDTALGKASTADAPTAEASAVSASAAEAAGTSDASAASPKCHKGLPDADVTMEAGNQPAAGLPSSRVDVLEAATPAQSGAAKAEASTARKSGSKAWLSKAGGILGRWTVPVKVKKEPRSKPMRVVEEVIDLT